MIQGSNPESSIFCFFIVTAVYKSRKKAFVFSPVYVKINMICFCIIKEAPGHFAVPLCEIKAKSSWIFLLLLI